MATQAPRRSRYLELVERFPLRPIRSEAQLTRAVAVVDSLLDQPKRSRDEADYLDVLSTLIERYEEEHHPMGQVSGVEMLVHLMDVRCLTQARVAEGSGLGVSTVSEILSGKRKLHTRHIAAFARFFGVDPGLFIER